MTILKLNTHARRLLPLVIAASCALLTACGGSGGDSDQSSSSSSSVSSSSSSSDQSSSSDDSSSSSADSSSSSSSSSSEEPEKAPVYHDLHTWWHDSHDAQDSGPVAVDKVRRSTVYDVQVATVTAADDSEPSFVYMTIPRSGKSKEGYTYEDGAEFSSSAQLSMSWSSFLYETDVWVTVDLKDGHSIQSVDEVTVRPTNLSFEKELVDADTVRIKVPYSETGYRFSVEFDHQLMTSYNNQRGGTGSLTEDAAGAEVHTEPRNSLMIFAEPILTAEQRSELVPDPSGDNVYIPRTGEVDLDAVDAEIVYFKPGVYYMPGNDHAYLPESVRWVYLAPGAYLKGALQFRNAATDYKVTGYGVLSGENYVYQADRDNGYAARDPEKSDCHASCVKMLEFASSTANQTLQVHGITVNEPPYHSFVVYGSEDLFVTDVAHYKQVGGWYWQTDGMEIYKGGSLVNSFFHANDDVVKIYHSNTVTDNVVVWKNENGPVIQFGWASRNIDNIQVSNIDVIHNRMYWQDQKHNTCIINSADLYSDTPMEKDKVSLDNTVSNLTFSNIRAEGMNLCAMRFLALSNWENIRIDGLYVDSWSGLPSYSQYSLFSAAYTEGDSPQQVQVARGAGQEGLQIHNYVVAGQPITKAGEHWGSESLGRLNFDAELWDSWNATSTLEAACAPQTVTISGLPAFVPMDTSLTLDATASSGEAVSLAIADGDAALSGTTLTFNGTPGGVQVEAVQAGTNGFCRKRAADGVAVYDPATGPGERWIGASWAGWSPSDVPMGWNAAQRAYEASVNLTAGNHSMKFTDTSNWSGDDWGSASGLTGTVTETTGGGSNVDFTVDADGTYLIRFNPYTNHYEIIAQ